MIEAHRLTKKFGSTTAVGEVSFKVSEGEIVGFLGPNGAGKSTTMRILAGLLVPDTGTASINGKDLVLERTAAQSLLGYMPEAAAGFSNLTVREFLTYCADCRGFGKDARQEAIDEVCCQTALSDALDQIIGTLSKGWRQRVWFAQSVIHKPVAVVLDEPTDGLDPGQKAHTRNYVREMSKRAAIILSTHILEEAEELCTRVIIIANGRILADEATKNLTDRDGRLAPAFAELTSAVAA